MIEFGSREIVGLLAGALLVAGFLPRILRLHYGGARELPLPGLLLIWLGVALWLVYGLLLAALPVILAGAVGLALVSLILLDRLRG